MRHTGVTGSTAPAVVLCDADDIVADGWLAAIAAGLAEHDVVTLPVADVEFSLRCWLHGIDIAGLPGAVVHYRYRADARSLWRQ